MITEIFLFIAYSIATSLVGLLPFSEGFPPEVLATLTDLGGYVGILDPIAPLSDMATVFSLVLAFELSLFAFKGVKWLVGFIPFIGKNT